MVALFLIPGCLFCFILLLVFFHSIVFHGGRPPFHLFAVD